MSEYIEVGQTLQFTDPNTPTRVGEIVENVSDIYNIPSPRLGMQVFVKSEKKTYTITGLKEAVIGGERVPNAKVDTFEAVKSQVEEIDNNFAEMREALAGGSFVVGVANLANAVKAGAVTFEMLDGKLRLSVSVVDDLETANTLMPLSANQGKILKELIDIINGTGEGSTDKKITDAIAALVDSAPENLNTLRELAEWIENHGAEMASIFEAINVNAKNLAETNKNIANQLIVTPTANSVEVVGRNEQSMRINFEGNIPAATTEKAGVMSAEDKLKLEDIDKTIVNSHSNDLDFVDANKNCIVRFAEGHIMTKNFDSRKNTVSTEEKTKLKSTGLIDVENCDMAITDEQNNAILVIADGHIKTKKFDSRTGVKETKYIDRDIYALGDSTTQGAGSGTESHLGNKSWFDRLVTKIQFRSYRKLAANGTVTMKQEGLGALSSQIKYLPVVGNPIILVMIGTNDINRTHEKGNVNAALAMQYEDLSETVSFAEAFRYNLETIKRRLPNAEIIAMMPLSPQLADESDAEMYRDIERTICRALSIPVLEVRNECGISKYCNYGFAQVAEDEIENATVFMADALHPNNAGYERIANYVATKLNKYIQ